MANQLKPGQELLANQQITANNGRAFLIMQGDGNFVLYEVHKGKHIPVWASGTDGSGAEKAVMRDNGNLVVYKANGQEVWQSGTAGNAGAYLILQDDGNAVIYTNQGKRSGTQERGAIVESLVLTQRFTGFCLETSSSMLLLTFRDMGR